MIKHLVVSYKCFIFIFESKQKKMETKQLTAKDVQEVANDLKIVINDDIVDMALEAYDDYCTQYPNDNWREIVETMLYDYIENNS